MATQKTVSDLFTEVESKTLNKFRNLSNTEKLELLNEALIAAYDDTMVHARSVIEKKVTLSFTGNSAPLPSDFNYSPSNDWTLHADSSYDIASIAGGKDIEYKIDGTDLRFNYRNNIGNDYYLRYLSEPNQYTDMSDTVLETISLRLKSIIKNELEHLLEIRKYQGQISASAQSARFKANELK